MKPNLLSLPLTEQQKAQVQRQLDAHSTDHYRFYPCTVDLNERFSLENFHVIRPVMRPDVMVSGFFARYLFEHRFEFKGKRVIDIGCGSGILGIVAAKYGEPVSVVFSDILEDACRNTRMNLMQQGLGPGDVRRSDLFENFSKKNDKADIIIFNHPFFAADSIAEEPLTISMLARAPKLLHRFLDEAEGYLRDASSYILMPFFHLAAMPNEDETNDPGVAGPRRGYTAERELFVDVNTGIQNGTVSVTRLRRSEKDSKAECKVHTMSIPTIQSAGITEISWSTEIGKRTKGILEEKFKTQVFQHVAREVLSLLGDDRAGALCVYVPADQQRIPSEILDYAGKKHPELDPLYQHFAVEVLHGFDFTGEIIARRKQYSQTKFFYVSFEPSDTSRLTEASLEGELSVDFSFVVRVGHGSDGSLVTGEHLRSCSKFSTFMGVPGAADMDGSSLEGDLLRYVNAMSIFSHARRYTYLLPLCVGTKASPIIIGSLLIWSEDRVSERILARALEIARRNLTPIRLDEFQAEVRRHALKSALAAIMSRNMSHNIGSHVLSALAVGSRSAADDRVLFRYLQQRMDYIALISTETPQWTVPAWFLSDIMKRFYKQRHLLDFIARSEGLSSHNWRDGSSTDSAGIVINVGRLHRADVADIGAPSVSENDSIEAIIDRNEIQRPIENDILLAIPGGIVGFHAFYTLLENIIRNAAKHQWSRSSLAGPLEINIVFEPVLESGYVNFVIFDNVSDCGKRPDLVKKINGAFGRCFVTDRAELRRESWGLGEIRISAGYLNAERIEVIGGDDGNVLYAKTNGRADSPQSASGESMPYRGFITATSVRRNVGGVTRETLGYALPVLVPKQVLCMGGWHRRLEQAKVKCAWEFGWVFSETSLPAARDYRLIICDGDWLQSRMTHHLGNEKLPCESNKHALELALAELAGRVLLVKPASGFPTGLREMVEGESRINRKIAIVNEEELLAECASRSFREAYTWCLANWVSSLSSGPGNGGLRDIALWVNVGTEESSDEDQRYKEAWQLLRQKHMEEVVKVLFFHIDCVNAELKLRVSTAVLEAVESIGSLEGGSGDFRFDLKQEIWSRISARIDEIAEDYTESERVQLNVLRLQLKPIVAATILGLISGAKEIIFKYDEDIETTPAPFNSRTTDHKKADLIMQDLDQAIVDVGSLSAFGQAGIDSKPMLRHAASLDDANIAYERHGKCCPPNWYYVEALSGAQYSFSALTQSLLPGSNEEDRKQLVLQLVETGLVSVCIIDERVANFYYNRPYIQSRFRMGRIIIPAAISVDPQKIGRKSPYRAYMQLLNSSSLVQEKIRRSICSSECIELSFLVGSPDSLDNAAFGGMGLAMRNVDIVIIHQGILEKLYPESREDRLEFLRSLRDQAPFVFITSGRGRPEGVAEQEKFVPFSSIEDYLLKDYPEKGLLIQSLMQVYADWESTQ